MREERLTIGDVPARLFVPSVAREVLLFGHGGGYSKDSPRFVQLALRYAAALGIAVVCIDAVDHGERRPPNPQPGLPREWHSSVSQQMVADWQATASALSSIGPAVAYVGFSMGALFGVPIVAAMPSISKAVLVAGGIPTGAWIDDAPLGPLLRAAAVHLDHADVLMLNMADDQLFPAEDVRALSDAIRGHTKRLQSWSGQHDDWPDDLIEESIAFLGGVRPMKSESNSGKPPRTPT